MVIDSDSEEEIVAKLDFAPLDYPQFEDVEEELDPSAPYPPIIQYLDLPLGTDVLHLSFPSVARDALKSSTSIPIIARQRIVVVVACTDQTIRAITLPLTPPSPAYKAKDEIWAGLKTASSGLGRWGEQVVVLGGDSPFQDIPNAVDVTFTVNEARTEAGDEWGGEAELTKAGRKRALESATKAMRRLSGGKKSAEGSTRIFEWDLVVAAHSPELSGVLQLYRVPIIATPTGSYKYYGLSRKASLEPFETQYLTSPASVISFNPSPYPAPRHSQLLIADETSSIKIYECIPPPQVESRPSSRRQSSSFMETTKVDHGSWLLTMYPGFDHSESPGTEALPNAKRKRVLDAQWVLGGRAVLVLLHDGEWGIWDVEGAGPTGVPEGRLSRELIKKGLQGGAKTAWNLSGWVGDRQRRQSKTRRGSSESSFAPRTPHTRQREEAKLFTAGASLDETRTYARGGLATRPIRSIKPDGLADEAVMMWHGDSFAAMPSVRTYWDTQLSRSKTGGSLFSAEGKDRLVTMGEVSLQGESVCDGDLFLPVDPKLGATKSTEDASRMPDVLVTGEHRLVMVMTLQPETAPAGKGLWEGGGQHVPPEDDASYSHTDRSPDFGNLALHGIERALSDMEKKGRQRRIVRFSSGDGKDRGDMGKRKVGFA